MPIVSTSKPKPSGWPTIAPADPDEAVCGCGLNAHVYEAGLDTAPTYTCITHATRQLPLAYDLPDVRD